MGLTEEGMISIKVAHCGQTKRTTFKKMDLNFETLSDWIVSAFGLSAPLTASPTRLAYRDPDGDVISIGSSDELSEALRLTPEGTVLALHLSFPRPRGERWFARMCAEAAMADEAAADLGQQTSSSASGDADFSKESPDAPTPASEDKPAAPADEMSWCERRRAKIAAWKARMAEARGAAAPGAPGMPCQSPPFGPHGFGPFGHHHRGHGHGPHPHRGGPHSGMGRPDFAGRPEFCGRPEFSAGRPDFDGRSDVHGPFARFPHYHHQHGEEAGAEHTHRGPHPHPFSHQGPHHHPHPWAGFSGAMMPPCFWMMPPCVAPTPFAGPMHPPMHPWAGFAVPSAFASAPTPSTAATAHAPEPALANSPSTSPEGVGHRHVPQREECRFIRQTNWIIGLLILLVVFHFLPLGALFVPILAAVSASMVFTMKRKMRKIKHARGHAWSARTAASLSPPSPSPLAASPSPAPIAVGEEFMPHHRRGFHGRCPRSEFPAPSAPTAAASPSNPTIVQGPVSDHTQAEAAAPFRRCGRFQPARCAPNANVSIVPPAPAAASPPEAPESPTNVFHHPMHDLMTLQAMGFTDMAKNRRLLRRLGDVNLVVAHLTDGAAH